MAVKYQVFLSSTYEDLKDERNQVIKATLELGHIPVGMEMFSASDEEQWGVITRQIDECDYYVVLIAHRYGSVIGGSSYTEKEYDYAISKGIPVLGFIIEKSANWPANMVDTDATKKQALDRFKEKVRGKPVGFWKSASDLYGMFTTAFIKAIVATPRTGWVRASDVAGPGVTSELSRLSAENASLRENLEAARQKSSDEILVERHKLINTLRKNKILTRVWHKDASGWDKGAKSTLLHLFQIIGPSTIIEETAEDLSKMIAAKFTGSAEYRSSWPTPRNTFNDWFADFVSLGLMIPSPRKHSAKEKYDYWTLTEEGREILKMIRLSELEMGDSEPNTPEPPLKSKPATKRKKKTAKRKSKKKTSAKSKK